MWTQMQGFFKSISGEPSVLTSIISVKIKPLTLQHSSHQQILTPLHKLFAPPTCSNSYYVVLIYHQYICICLDFFLCYPSTFYYYCYSFSILDVMLWYKYLILLYVVFVVICTIFSYIVVLLRIFYEDFSFTTDSHPLLKFLLIL